MHFIPRADAFLTSRQIGDGRLASKPGHRFDRAVRRGVGWEQRGSSHGTTLACKLQLSRDGLNGAVPSRSSFEGCTARDFIAEAQIEGVFHLSCPVGLHGYRRCQLAADKTSHGV